MADAFDEYSEFADEVNEVSTEGDPLDPLERLLLDVINPAEFAQELRRLHPMCILLRGYMEVGPWQGMDRWGGEGAMLAFRPVHL